MEIQGKKKTFNKAEHCNNGAVFGILVMPIISINYRSVVSRNFRQREGGKDGKRERKIYSSCS